MEWSGVVSSALTLGWANEIVPELYLLVKMLVIWRPSKQADNLNFLLKSNEMHFMDGLKGFWLWKKVIGVLTALI
jgi:hypothetical protein